MTTLITGCYGFLGHATAKRLLEEGRRVVGIDKVANAISEKTARIASLNGYDKFEFHDIDLSHRGAIEKVFDRKKDTIDSIIHYAGQYSVKLTDTTAPRFLAANLVGYYNLMEVAWQRKVQRVVYASSTFVQDGMLSPSMYGSTKEFGERCGYVWAAEGMSFIALRFGSVYGPLCRHDIGPWHLITRVFKGEKIDVTKGGFNYKVAFVYVDDAVEVAVRCLGVPMEMSRLADRYSVQTVVAEDNTADLDDMLQAIEKHSGIRAKRVGQLTARQDPIVPTRECDSLRKLIGFAPTIKMDEGVGRFVEWYRTNRSR